MKRGRKRVENTWHRFSPHQEERTAPMKRGRKLTNNKRNFIERDLRGKDGPDEEGTETFEHAFFLLDFPSEERTAPMKRGRKL